MKHIVIVFLFILSSFISFSQIEAEEINPKIYSTDTITWFGADFSLFKLANRKKNGQEEKLMKYIYAWNTQYRNYFTNVKMARLLSLKKVYKDFEFTNNVSDNYNESNWISSTRHSINYNDIENHISNFDSENDGIGLVYIIECFNKYEISKVHGYFVWFKIETKEILYIDKTEGKPTTGHLNSWGVEISWDKNMPKNKGMTGFWFQGMIDATIKFTFDYKENDPKEDEKEDEQY